MINDSGRSRTYAWFGSGLFVGGLASGVALLILSGLVPDFGPFVVLAVVVAATIAAVLRDTATVAFWLPENRRQVRRTVTENSPSVASWVFGFELGTGVRTYLPGTAPYVAALVALVTSSLFWFPLMIGVGFALGRYIVALEYLVSRGHRRWEQAVRASARSTTIVASVVVGILAVVAVLWL